MTPLPKLKADRPGPVSDLDSFTSQDYKQLINLSSQGFTIKQLAEFYGVTDVTIYQWKKKNRTFARALKAGKIIADQKVVKSLYLRACGYSHPEEKIFQYAGRVTKVQTIKHYPPDPVSMIFWLKNRQPDKWKDKQAVSVEIDEKILEALLAPFPADYAKIVRAEVWRITKVKK